MMWTSQRMNYLTQNELQNSFLFGLGSNLLSLGDLGIYFLSGILLPICVGPMGIILIEFFLSVIFVKNF